MRKGRGQMGEGWGLVRRKGRRGIGGTIKNGIRKKTGSRGRLRGGEGQVGEAIKEEKDDSL